MQGVLDTIQKLGPARIAAMSVVTALLIGFFAFISLRVAQEPLAPLYSDLSIEDSSAIIEFLEGQGIRYELANNGSTISIEQDKILRTRMTLAGDGLPQGGNVGYEIFDKTDTLGTTSFVQNINHIRALEGELSRTIRSINRIRAARVHLVIPERKLFQKEKQPPTASIALKVRGVLDANQIRAIQHMVASAVDGLSPRRVSIVDEAGNLLASGTGEDGPDAMLATVQAKTTAVQDRLRLQIQDILTGVVGPGRARIQVAAELEMNRVTQTSDVFDPESQVVRSTQSRSQESESQERRPNNAVTVNNELPAANADANNTPDETEATNNTEEVVNYEISRTTTTQVREAGSVKRLSVAVLVDGIYTKAADGTLKYQPRSDEELARLATLVRSAVGFDEKRGDTVEVVNLQFAEKPNETELATAEAGLFDFTKYDYFRMAELAVMAVLTILVLMLVVRPLLKRVLENSAPEQVAQAAPAAAELSDPNAGAAAAQAVAAAKDTGVQAVDEAKRKGLLRAEVVNEVGTMVSGNPDAAVSVIRDLLREAA